MITPNDRLYNSVSVMWTRFKFLEGWPSNWDGQGGNPLDNNSYNLALPFLREIETLYSNNPEQEWVFPLFGLSKEGFVEVSLHHKDKTVFIQFDPVSEWILCLGSVKGEPEGTIERLPVINAQEFYLEYFGINFQK